VDDHEDYVMVAFQIMLWMYHGWSIHLLFLRRCRSSGEQMTFANERIRYYQLLLEDLKVAQTSKVEEGEGASGDKFKITQCRTKCGEVGGGIVN
jgi:hypothetical protein